jgi:hypothetical protein
MTAWPRDDMASMCAFYGDPRGRNGNVSLTWANANLVPWTPPYPMLYSDGKRTPLRTLTVHRKCRDTFDAAFKDVLAQLGLDYIRAHRLNISGGANNYRMERGGNRLSVHSWGAAIDMDPGHNPFPAEWKPGMIDKRFADILQAHGFTWRGANGDIDPMHFQLASHHRG